MSFMIFQNEKTPFQAIKTRSSKSRKIDIFPKGLTHGFHPKSGHFSKFFFLGNISLENVFCDILERKNASLGYKTRSSKSPKIDIFPKGLTHYFSPKMSIFKTFFFIQYRPGKCLLGFSRKKNPFLRYENKNFKKSKNCNFSKGFCNFYIFPMVLVQ